MGAFCDTVGNDYLVDMISAHPFQTNFHCFPPSGTDPNSPTAKGIHSDVVFAPAKIGAVEDGMKNIRSCFLEEASVVDMLCAMVGKKKQKELLALLKKKWTHQGSNHHVDGYYAFATALNVLTQAIGPVTSYKDVAELGQILIKRAVEVFSMGPHDPFTQRNKSPSTNYLWLKVLFLALSGGCRTGFLEGNGRIQSAINVLLGTKPEKMRVTFSATMINPGGCQVICFLISPD